MKKIIFTIVLTFAVIGSFAQNTFMKSYNDFENDAWGDQVIVSVDGYLISGVCLKDNIYQLFLMKTDLYGNKQWLNYYDFDITDHGNWSTSDKDDDNNIYMAFENSSTTNLVKFSPTGETQWAVKFPDNIYQVKYMDNGELLIAVSQGNSVKIKRVDPGTGSLIAESVPITSTTPLITTTMSVLSDNTIVLSVSSNVWNNAGSSTLYYFTPDLSTVNSSGLQYSESVVHRSSSVINDELISVGHIAQYATTDNRSYVSKYDTSGSVDFANLILYPSRVARLSKHVINYQDQIVALGEYSTSDIPGMVLLRGMTLDGDSLWTSLLTMNEMVKGYDLKMTNDGGYVVTGRTFAVSKEMPLLIKTNAAGLIVGSKQISQPDNILVYPNPASDQVVFEFVEKTNGSIIVTDLSGHKCIEFEVNGLSTVFDTRQLEQGVYFYTLKTDSSVSTGKLLINH